MDASFGYLKSTEQRDYYADDWFTENFLPKVDGVTRTLARLLEHLKAEGHEALVCGPGNGLVGFARYTYN